MQDFINEERLTPVQVARLLSVHIATVWRWMLRGVRGRTLASVQIGGRRWVLKRDLDVFLTGDNTTWPTLLDTKTAASLAAVELDAMGVGKPAARDQDALLRNREQLLKYLLMLLTDDEEAARRLIEAFDADGQNQHADRRDGGFGLPLLEPLLHALDRQPARLDQISRLIDDLRKSPEGAQLISNDFLSVWEPIWTARKQIGNE